MVFFGSLAGSNTVTTDTFTTTGLVTSPAFRIGPLTTVNESINFIRFGFVSGITGVTSTGSTLVTVTVSGIATSTNIYVTPYYGGAASPLPSVFARVYDKSAGSFRAQLRIDDETPGTFTCAFYYIAFE